MYSPEQLFVVVNGINAKIDETKLLLEAVRNELVGKKASLEKVKLTYDRVFVWVEKFRIASTERKKMIISQLALMIKCRKLLVCVNGIMRARL